MTLEHRLHARCACGSALSSYAEGAGSRPFALAGTKRVYERARPFAIHHIALALELEVDQKAFRGTATLDVSRVDPAATEIALDARGLRDRVRRGADGGGAFARAATCTTARRCASPARDTGDGPDRVNVAYRAVPRRGLYFLAPDEHVPDRPAPGLDASARTRTRATSSPATTSRT